MGHLFVQEHNCKAAQSVLNMQQPANASLAHADVWLCRNGTKLHHTRLQLYLHLQDVLRFHVCGCSFSAEATKL